MHGLSGWLSFLLEYWAMILFFSILVFVYIIITIVFYVKFKDIKTALLWPTFYIVDK